MIKIRRAQERGHFDLGWLDTWHTFSFGDYHDPLNMNFRCLRVVNEDWVQPGKGFGPHPHRDMEILTYVLDGALEHKDSLGNGSVIRPGDVQRMSAGTGVTHSEWNASKKEPVHLLQIWILPSEKGLPPSYEQKHFPEKELRGTLRRIADPRGRDGSVTVRQDVVVCAGLIAPQQDVNYPIKEGRCGWVQVARGSLYVNGELLEEGDGAALRRVPLLKLEGKTPAEVLFFDLP